MSPVKVKKLAVSAAGQSQVFVFDTTGKSVDNMGWVQQQWEFEAAADQTTLEFATADRRDEYAGPALDNVRVVAAPNKK